MGKRNPNYWNKLFRLSLVEDQTHKRIRSWHFSRITGIIGILLSIVCILLLFYALFALTPLKSTIPGYPDAHFKRNAIANALKIDSLESEMAKWSLYAEKLSSVLSGEESLVGDSLLRENSSKYLKDLSEQELARRDSLLRAEVSKKEQKSADKQNDKITLPIEGMHFYTPLKGTISRGFDMVLHPAIDITAPANSVVGAVLGGTVIISGWTEADGYTIAIQHPGDVISVYKHNQKLLKLVGDKISAGDPIALVGNTGSSLLDKGDHLHFELWYKGDAVDPTKYCTF